MDNTIVQNQAEASITKMLLVSLLVLLPGFTGGAAISYTAVALPFYMDPDNDSGIVMTPDQASWFVALNSPMQMVGNVLSGYLMDRLGRKLTLTCSSCLVILASCLLSLAPSYPLLLLGCLLNGSSVGCVRPTVGLYLSEIATVQWRGPLSSFNALTPNAGYLYGILVGSQLPLWAFPWVMVVPCMVFLPFSLVIPDSPLWLMKVGRSDAARAALVWLRGESYKLEPELKELEVLLCTKEKAPPLRQLLTRRSFLLPVSLLSFMFCMHASVGADVLSYYGLTLMVFPQVDLSPSVLAVLFQSSITLGMLVSPLLMTRINRRTQFSVGCLAIAVNMLLLGLDNYSGFSATTPAFSYLPPILLMSFGLSFGLGIGAVPYALSGELFPQQLRSWGCGVGLACRYVGAFLQLKMFLLVVSWVGMSGFYWLQGCSALLGAVVVLALLPETKDMTFTQLERIFDPKSQEKNPV